MENKSKIMNDRKLINNNQSLKSSGGEKHEKEFFLIHHISLPHYGLYCERRGKEF